MRFNYLAAEVTGDVHTSSGEGRFVERDINRHLNIDIPLTNQDYLDKSVENINV